MQTIQDQVVSSYDHFPYESNSFPQSHPDRLATLAKLFGLNSPKISEAKVLELGCASGGNLLPLAFSYPNAHFTGIDLSSRQISTGQALIEKFNLKNIELKHLDLMKIEKDFGEFDYIVAHGVYSWVSKHVQAKILEICDQNLTEKGVAYVSYNTYPGWHFRGMIRDMMLYHTAQFPDPGAKVVQARALLDFLSNAVPADNAYGLMLKNELDLIAPLRDSYVLHEHLEEKNQPVYFHEFAEEASKHNLQYLSEADFSLMITTNFAPQVGETLRRLSNDIVRTEQYMDFVRNRAFRQTLLCRKGVQLNRNLDWRSVKDFRIASATRTEASQAELVGNQQVQFVVPKGVTMTVANPVVKVAFNYMSQIWPRSASFDELLATITQLSPTVIQDSSSRQKQEQLLGTDLLTAYAAGIVSFRTEEPHFVVETSSHPIVSPLVRHQAESGQRITNQLHESADAEVLVRNIVLLLDGTRDVQSIVTELEKLIGNGTLNVHKDGKQLTGGEELRQTLAKVTEDILTNLTKLALLIG
jgi:methyltransferase-like protein/SAM-dependent methyltransferase